MRISDSVAENLLKASGKYTKKQLADLRAEAHKTKRPLQDIIIKEGLLSETDLTRLYAEEVQIPYVEIAADQIHHRALNLLPQHVAARYHAIVFDVDDQDKSIKVAMTDPHDYEALGFIRKALGDNLKIHVTTAPHLRHALDQYAQRSSGKVFHVVTEQMVDHDPTRINNLDSGSASESVRYIIERAVRFEASDIHIEPRLDHVVVRFRIDGLLREVLKLPINALNPLLDYLKEVAGLDRSEHGMPQYGNWSVDVADQFYSLRLSILPTVDGEKVTMHVLPQTPKAPTLRELGLWGTSLYHLEKAMLEPHGVILTSGPVGSGKSMTLFSMLSAINSVHINIATIEDPVEYRIQGINQVQVNPGAGATMLSGFKAAIAQDANVIMLSHLEENELAHATLLAGTHGRLIISSLHSGSATATLKSLVNMGVEPFLVGSSVRVVIGQRLARRLCPQCRVVFTPSLKEVKELESTLSIKDNGGMRRLHELESEARNENVGGQHQALSTTARGSIQQLWKAQEGGCAYCEHTGYRGRVGIFEVLQQAAPIEKALTKGASLADLNSAAITSGMIPMQIDGLVKALRGLTSPAEVLRVMAHRS